MPAAKGRIAAMSRIFILIFTALGIQVAGYFYAGSFQNIGIMISLIIIVIIITSFAVIKNPTIMKLLEK